MRNCTRIATQNSPKPVSTAGTGVSRPTRPSEPDSPNAVVNALVIQKTAVIAGTVERNPAALSGLVRALIDTGERWQAAMGTRWAGGASLSTMSHRVPVRPVGHDDDMTAERPAPPAEGLDIPVLLARTEELLLGGERLFTRAQVCERAGVPLDAGRVVWRALGFATTGDDQVVFTEADVDALRTVRELVSGGTVTAEDVAAIARLMGQSMYRLASTEGQFLLERVLSDPGALASEDSALELVRRLSGAVASLQDYVWRRQIASFLERVVARASEEGAGGTRGAGGADGTDGTGRTVTVVGFADMAGFTSRTRTSSEAQLRDLLAAFESLTADAVAAHGGRVVKTIGDEVLFTAEEPAAGALLALDLRDAASASVIVPELRIGLAAGPVVTRLGDVFGATVNIASRLTSLARPGWTLVDRGMADALAGDERFALRPRRPESVRGYHHLRQWRLQRPQESGHSRRRR